MSGDARAEAARIARLSYGRLVAILASRSRDIAAAEDALSEALARALERWPRDGVPDNPEGWIMTTAKRLQIDRVRADRVASRAHARLVATEEAHAVPDETGDDALLGLLFACAHPAIAERDRTPLMLQAVLGLDARRIASAFLASPGTVGQRLTRAKAKIAAAGVAFEVPAPEHYPARLASVLDAVYAAYTLGWDGAHDDDAKTDTLAREAIWLAGLLAVLLPGEGETHGLLALVLFCESRREARRDASSGAFVALADQDVSRWDRSMIETAEDALRRGGRVGATSAGRYQLEAAIQAVHAARRTSGRIDRDALVLLYERLLRIAPTVGARTAVGLAALDAIPEDARRTYPSWWAARGHLAGRIGRDDEARASFTKAAGLTEDPAVRAHLLARAVCPGTSPDRLPDDGSD